MISMYKTMASMCRVIKVELLKAIPVMLSGDRFIFLNARKIYKCYEEAMNVLYQLQNNPSKQARALTKLQSVYLAEKIPDSSRESAVEVFRKFLAKLLTI